MSEEKKKDYRKCEELTPIKKRRRRKKKKQAYRRKWEKCSSFITGDQGSKCGDCENRVLCKLNAETLLARVCMTIDGVWIGNRIYLTHFITISNNNSSWI
jgi:hypothetical protein